MSSITTEAAQYQNMTATTTIPGPLYFNGVFCASSTSGTLTVQDGAENVTGSISLVAGQYYKIPGYFTTSAVLTIGGTANITAFWS